MIYDTDTRKLYAAPGRPLPRQTITRGDSVTLSIQLQPPASGARVAYAARPQGDWTGTPGMVAYATTNAQGVAVLSPATITTELDRVLGVGTGLEVSHLILSAEVSLIRADNTRVTSHPVEVCYHNNIDRPGDLPGAKIPYPPADRLVTNEAVVDLVERTKKGDTGKSAYELAVAGGYKGTEAQWLESLKGSAVAKGATYKPALTKPTPTSARLAWTNDGGLTNPDPVTLDIPKGDSGKSAYEIAVAGGYAGTEAEWIASLKGLPGTPGKSAYEAALAGGYAGSESQWLSSLKGDPGTPGKSAYEAAVSGGYGGSEAQWLASLKGNPGDPGMSAYQVAVAGGYGGSESQWLSSLKGPKGDAGDPTTLLAKANTWTNTQTIKSGQAIIMSGPDLSVRMQAKTTTTGYTGYKGLALHNCRSLMLFYDDTESSEFIFIKPSGEIEYSVSPGTSKRQISLPREWATPGQLLSADPYNTSMLKWIDPPEGGNKVTEVHSTLSRPAINLPDGWFLLTLSCARHKGQTGPPPEMADIISTRYFSACDQAAPNCLLLSGEGKIDTGTQTAYVSAFSRPTPGTCVGWRDTAGADWTGSRMDRFTLTCLVNISADNQLLGAWGNTTEYDWTIVANKLS